MTTITINSGWFRAAGNVYHWTSEHHIFGVGIDTEKIKNNNELEIVGMGKRVGVVSKSILQPIDEI